MRRPVKKHRVSCLVLRLVVRLVFVVFVRQIVYVFVQMSDEELVDATVSIPIQPY